MRSLIFTLLILFSSLLYGQEKCDQIQFEPFPEEIVVKVLERFNVEPIEWVPINRKLKRRVDEVDTRVQLKAGKLERNPFDEPAQLLVITRLKREVLIEIFANTLKEHGVDDLKKAHDMYDAILNEKAQKAWECYYRNQ